MVAAANKNDELFKIMMSEDIVAVQKTLFHAANLPDPNTVRVSEYCMHKVIRCPTVVATATTI